MQIKIEYQPNAQELANASSLFIEKKPLFLYIVGFFNFISGFILIVMLVKWFLMGLLANEWLALGIAIMWLFGRKPFNEWLLLKRMKNSPVVGKLLTVDLSLNGIVWSGTGLRDGHLAWDNIRYVFEANNGFLLPNNFTQFLWLPFRGFTAPQDVQQFRAFIATQKMAYRIFKKWKC